MSDVKRDILDGVIDASAEAVIIVRLDQTDWPIVLANRAFAAMGVDDAVSRPFADVIEALLGRELALEISAALRAGGETSFPVEIGGSDHLLTLTPLALPDEDSASHFAVFFRGGAQAAAGGDAHHALLKAKRRIRDLTREDPVTGLLNERAFRDVLAHDWAVAAREKSTLALVLFSIDEFDAYVEVFGRHASDSCLRRVGQAIRRCLRRASDVVASLDEARLIVLSHASAESAVREFADRIATSVRDLGLHHPRAKGGRFVTVSQRVAAATAGEGDLTAEQFLEAVLDDSARD